MGQHPPRRTPFAGRHTMNQHQLRPTPYASPPRSSSSTPLPPPRHRNLQTAGHQRRRPPPPPPPQPPLPQPQHQQLPSQDPPQDPHLQRPSLRQASTPPDPAATLATQPPLLDHGAAATTAASRHRGRPGPTRSAELAALTAFAVAPPRRRRVPKAFLLSTMRFNHHRLHVTLGPEPPRCAGPAAPAAFAVLLSPSLRRVRPAAEGLQLFSTMLFDSHRLHVALGRVRRAARGLLPLPPSPPSYRRRPTHHEYSQRSIART